MSLSRHDIINAFTPSHEVEDPELFAGRREQLLQVLDALHENMSVPLVYGERGLGKSSLAVQLGLIARGNNRLLEILEATDRALPQDKLYTVIYISCTRQTASLNDMLQLAVNKLQRIEIATRKGTLVVQDKSTKTNFGPSWLGHERATSKSIDVGAVTDYRNLSVEEQVVALASSVTEQTSRPVLIVFDELDLVADTNGLAEYLRNASTHHLRFALVGIAASVTDLLSDHASLGRRLRPVRIPAMKPLEMFEILAKVLDRLRSRGWDVSLERDAVLSLVTLAGGYPWFIHIVGKEAFVRVYDEGRERILDVDIESARAGLLQNQFAEQYSGLYRRAVKNSSGRELVLRAYAQDPLVAVNTPSWNARLNEVGLTNPNQYKRQLEKEDCGSVLIRVPGDTRAVRFVDEIFKAYVRLVTPINSGVRAKVAEVVESLS